MLKWLKSDPAKPTVQPASRPPWIQKISVPAEPQKNSGEELAWKSRLAEKLRELKRPNSEPTGVLGEAAGKNFAFHVTPLDSFSAGSAAMFRHKGNEEGSGETAAHQGYAAVSPESESSLQTEPLPQTPAAERDARLEYRLVTSKQRTSIDTPYELSYSTIDYEKGEEFDLDALFENFGTATPQGWNPPEDAIQALSPAEDAGAGLLAEHAERVMPAEPDERKIVSAGPVPAQQASQAPEENPAPRVNEPEIANRDDRASVTPRIVMNRQQELRFPILKTQRKALEFADPAEAQSVIERLEETLQQFSIEGHVVGIQRGPIITRYELKMAAGIKVSRILALTDELAMALEAMRVRIEAPIPGRSTVGIEIPNKQRIKVLLGDILNDVGYREFSGALPLPLGRDIAGNLLLEDLTRMPHLLIAGATGSGKSVAVNSFISSLILHKTPEEVRFLLIDPKLVELSGYNDIPHLLHPVITEPNKAILALNWAVEEMERRYEDLAEMSARDIRSYNEKIRSQKNKAELPLMPYIVVLIDELGDLMMVAGKEVESSIIRLAQKARAVGIHLILATQRPSVDVITALIKANCPARIALQVAQKTDSRTILDSNGAEQLLGQGDMLFRHPSKAQLIRAQVPLIEDNEVEDVVRYAKKLAKPAYITLEDPKGKMGELEAGDEELFEEAWQIIVESQKASASYLQRRLRIGYNKAARLIEAFEARGMIGPQIGSKPREIIGGTGQGAQARVT